MCKRAREEKEGERDKKVHDLSQFPVWGNTYAQVNRIQL